MEIWIYYVIFAIMLVVFFFFFFYIVAYKWIHFGIKLWFAKQKYKSNTGFLLIRNSGNDFSMPLIIDLRDLKKEIGHDTYVYSRSQLQGVTLFGLPFVMFDNDDNKASLGLYVQDSGERDLEGNIINSESLYYCDESGDYITDKHGQKIPILTQYKPSISLPTSLFKSVVTQETFKNLKNYIKNVISVYKWVFGIIACIGVGIGVILYFMYAQHEAIPMILTACQEASRSCGGL